MGIVYTRDDICKMFETVRHILNASRRYGHFSDDKINWLRTALLDAMDSELLDTAQNYSDCVMWCISLEHTIF